MRQPRLRDGDREIDMMTGEHAGGKTNDITKAYLLDREDVEGMMMQYVDGVPRWVTEAEITFRFALQEIESYRFAIPADDPHAARNACEMAIFHMRDVARRALAGTSE